MHLFQIRPDEAGLGKLYDYDFDATSKWGLPGIRCPVHGPMATAGLAYPAIDLSVLPAAEEYREPRLVEVEEFEALRHPLLPLMPNGSVPLPGTQFGPLVGVARGIFGDFAWPDSWSPLIRREALERLNVAGIRSLVAVPTELTFKDREVPDEYERSFSPAYWAGAEPQHARTEPADLLELQIEPHARLAAVSLPADRAPSCPICGHRRIQKPERIVIERSSIPKQMDLFRVRELPTLILATEQFAEAVRALGLTDIVTKEVEVTS